MNFNPDKEPIGVGHEKKVYDDPHSKERVVGVYHEHLQNKTLNQVKGRYYLQKILHLLFPKNIPDIHESTQSYVVTDKKERDIDHMAFQELKKAQLAANEKGEDTSSLYWPIKEKFDAIEDKGNAEANRLIGKLSQMRVVFDSSLINFSTGSDGNVTYLDTFDPWFIGIAEKHLILIPHYNKEKLLQVINTLEDPEKSQALKFFYRLNELQDKDTQALLEK
jgi:hypothetical protein